MCLDGPAGSGKTALAGAVATSSAGTPATVRVVHLDDLYDGWAGLDGVGDALGGLLGPLAEGRAGSYRRYDWHARAFVETVEVAPVPLLVLEGVGSGTAARTVAPTLLAWVEAPPDLRLARGLARDGEALQAQWVRWQRREDAHFARERTRARADVVVDGTGRLAPTAR